MPGADDEPTAEIYIEAGPNGSVREGTIASNTIQATYSPSGANIRFIGNSQVGNHRVGMWTIAGNLIGSQQTNIHLTSVRGVTIDGNKEHSYLLQIFMKDAASLYADREAGPFFYEVIQRKGDKGFGAGNFRSLFESIERDQKAAGRV